MKQTQLLIFKRGETPFFKRIVSLIFILVIFSSAAYAQNKSTGPTWWFGVSGGINSNHFHGTTSSLNRDATTTPAFNKGNATGAYGAVVIEFHQPGSIVGAMLTQGLDNRNGKFEESGKKLDLNLSYYTVEPSIVVNVPKTNLYVYAGPRFGFVWATDFTYKQPNKPDYPNNADPNSTEVYLRSLRKNPISMQVGAGYNFWLTPKSAINQFIVSPFVTYLPSLGQNLRTIESLKLNTLRAGITIKAGHTSIIK